MYQLHFTVFMFVTRISRYISRSVLSVVSHKLGRSWNVLPVNTGALLYFSWLIVKERTATHHTCPIVDLIFVRGLTF
jgi:hypothetical protein